jgi:hypothetical protein
MEESNESNEVAGEISEPNESNESSESNEANESNQSSTELLAALLGGEQPQEPEPKKQPKEPEPQESEPKEQPQEWTLSSLEAEQEWTPEKLLSAKQFLLENYKKIDRHWRRSNEKRQKLEKSQAEFEQNQAFWKEKLAAIEHLRGGTVEQSLNALASLTGLPAATVLERLSMGVTDEHTSEATEIGQLKKQLAALEKLQREQQEQQQQQEIYRRNIANVRDGFSQAIRMQERWPFLAEVAAKDPSGAVNQLTDQLVREFESGKVWTVSDFCSKLNGEIATRMKQGGGPRQAVKKASSRSGATPRRTVVVEKAEKMTETERLESLMNLFERRRN